MTCEHCGWRPPPRRIETVEDLVGEPNGTVIRFRHGEIGVINTASGRWPGRVHILEPHNWSMPEGFISDDFPAEVLRTPGGAA